MPARAAREIRSVTSPSVTTAPCAPKWSGPRVSETQRGRSERPEGWANLGLNHDAAQSAGEELHLQGAQLLGESHIGNEVAMEGGSGGWRGIIA